MKKIINTLFFLVLYIGSICSQQFNSAKLDSVMDALESNDKFMGSLAVSHNGEILYSRAIGYADIESKKEATPATIYRIGSISKMFTTALIFKAIEENKLSLNQTIDKFFPDLKNADKITISNLLNHRSGIFSFTDDPDYKNWCTQPKTEDELLDIIRKGEAQFEPNNKAAYSNSNFILLTFILEKIYNKSYKELLTEKILEPLGLMHTYLGGKTNIDEGECYSYKYLGKWVKEPETDMSIPLGAGAIESNPEDLTYFIENLFAGKIISDSSLKQMTTIIDGYGRGIFQVPFYEKKGFGHGGGIDGFTSMVAYFPDDTVSIALTSNGTNFKNNDLLIDALSCYYDRPFKLPEFSTFKVNTEEFHKYEGIYASEQIPLKITISVKEGVLTAQATGQSAFGLEPSEKDVFKFNPAGVVMRFTPEKNKFVLEQGGGVYTFIKE